jgi:alkanesulfonate monooxygenase SsuD/methylene tetrahydromethanopterin reductase-like flavin-dependent oxidoreductase (luciferase family)
VKLDVGLGTEGKYLKNMDRTARAAEDLGFAGLWTSETKHDAFLPLAIAAGGTRRMDLGTSVAIAFSRSPMETAQTAWDLQDLSDGRFIPGTDLPPGCASTSSPCGPSGNRSRPRTR